MLYLTCVETNFRISLNPVYPQQLDGFSFRVSGKENMMKLMEKLIHLKRNPYIYHDKRVTWKES